MNKKLSVRDGIRSAIDEEMATDKNIILLGEEVAEYMGAYKITGDLYKKYNTDFNIRIIDTPITEHGFAGIAVGAAFAGLRPIVEFMTFNFSMQAIDQIVNSAAKTRYMSGGKISCPIVFRGPNGAAARVAAQHSQDFTSWFAHIPGLIVIAPYFSYDCKALLKSAIRNDNPVIFLENEICYNHEHEIDANDNYVDKDGYSEISKARIYKNGSDLTIVSYSRSMNLVINALKDIEMLGINPEIIDLRTIRPLDKETIINSVKKTNKILIVEEAWPYCSVGSEIISLVNKEIFDYLDAAPVKINAKDVPLPYASNLEKLALPSIKDIIDACVDLHKNKI
jgi:pyruvate dehydrogenase E1 component beta subunit